MKLFLILILSLFIYGGSRVTGERNPEDLPDLKMNSVVPPEDLVEMNRLRKDILKSLKGLVSEMETDKDKNIVEEKIFGGAFIYFTFASEKIRNDVIFFDHVLNVKDVINDLLGEEYLNKVMKDMENESDKKKVTNYVKKVQPDFRKRFERYREYMGK